MISTPSPAGTRRRAAAAFIACATLVVGAAQWATPSARAAEPLRRTSPAAIVARASTWVVQQVPYSQRAYAADPSGKRYRTDCSGFVSMAWGLDRSLTTGSLPSVATPLGPVGSYAGLRAGDMLDTTDGHHAVLFVRWADPGRTTAVVFEEPHPGAVAHADDEYYTTALLAAEGYVAYRYRGVRTPVSMDWNGDGAPDRIAHRVSDGSLWLLPGPGRAHRPAQRIAKGLTQVTSMVELADVTIAGAPSIVVRMKDGSVWSYPRAARATLGRPIRVTGRGQRYDSIAPAGVLDPTGILARSPDGKVWLLRGDGSGGFQPAHALASWSGREALVSVGGLGADGFPRIFGRTPDGTIWLHSGDGRGEWASARAAVSTAITLGQPPLGREAEGADTANGLTRLMRAVRQSAAASRGSSVSAAGDGGDLLVRRVDGSLWLLRSDGRGGFAAPVLAGGHWSGYDLVL